MDYERLDSPAPRMPKSELLLLIEELRELKRVATMERADFDGIMKDKISFPSNQTRTEFIKSETRIYRDTWLISPLDSLIERYEAALREQYGTEA